MSASIEDEVRAYSVQLEAAVERRMRVGNRLAPLPRRQPDRISRRWMRRGLAASLGAAAIATALVIGVGGSGGDPVQVVDGSPVPLPSGSVSSRASSPATATPGPGSLESASTSSASGAASEIDSTLVLGDSGADVRALQTRLAELHFAPGPVTGDFDEATAHAVWAYKTLVAGFGRGQLAKADHPEAVSPDLWLQMQQPQDITPRRVLDASVHIEVYLPEQVLVVFENGHASLIAHVSSGSGQPYCETVAFDTDDNGGRVDPPATRAICSRANTPGGVFTITRSLAGSHVSSLDAMDDPLYFNYGIAMYGARNVPLLPASHGGVRLDAVADAALVGIAGIGDPVYVWGEDGREPEEYTKAEMTPTFSYPDPDATTTTVAALAMPLLTGLRVADALDKLSAAGLVGRITAQDFPAESVDVGRVIAQSIGVGTLVPAGSSVDIVVGVAVTTPTSP